jgi:hypothetical protein
VAPKLAAGEVWLPASGWLSGVRKRPGLASLAVKVGQAAKFVAHPRLIRLEVSEFDVEQLPLLLPPTWLVMQVPRVCERYVCASLRVPLSPFFGGQRLGDLVLRTRLGNVEMFGHSRSVAAVTDQQKRPSDHGLGVYPEHGETGAAVSALAPSSTARQVGVAHPRKAFPTRNRGGRLRTRPPTENVGAPGSVAFVTVRRGWVRCGLAADVPRIYTSLT